MRLGWCIVAFLVPLVIRIIPEVIAWPYPIGFDTLIYAVWMSRGTYLTLGLADLLKDTNLFYVIATVVSRLFGNAVLAVKALGPVLFSLLCGSLHLYGRRVSGWSPRKVFIVSILAGTYFVSLRISWEMYRQMLGTIFLIVGLVGLRLSSLRWRIFVVTLSGFLAVWSHELVAVLFLVIMAAHILFERSKGLRSKILLVLMAMPTFLLFIYQRYSPSMGSISVPYESVSSASWMYSVAFISGFLGFMFLPLLPLAALGALSFREFDMLSWLLMGLLFAYWPVFFPEYSVRAWLRWAILLAYPVVFLSVEGLGRLWRLGKQLLWKVSVERLLALSILLLNLVMSGYYLTSMPEHQIKYFGEWNHYKQYIQTSMLQNSVSLSDTPDVVEAMEWLDEEVAGTNSVLVLHEAMDNWAQILIQGIEIIRVNEVPRSSPVRENAATRLVHLAAEKIEAGKDVYTVWWVDGKGWYNMPELPPQFKDIQRFGNIGVFQYARAEQ